MRALLALAAAAELLAQAPALPPRFAIPPAEPVIRKAAQPAKFIESVGRRVALLGREDGTFEAWTMPVKVLRDFRLSVYFDGALEPVPLADLAERVAVSPGRVTITHSHAAFTIRQTWIASLDQPAAAVLLDIETGRPLRLRAAFQLEMRPMWPAGFGGQSSAFVESERALVASEGLRRHAAVIGSPLFSRSSEQVGHQMPDRTVLLEMDVTPETARAHLVPIVIAGSGAGSKEARALYRKILADLPGLIAQSDAYYREFQKRTLQIETPLPALTTAFEWAKYAIDKGWQCNDGIGCGLVAGFGPSGASERPGFAWYFGGDALMNSWSILDYGDFERARGVLEFLRGRQRDDGKIMHELTQSAALIDWSKYPYGYYHGDTTPLYIFSTAEYAFRSGDREFLRASLPSIERAYRFCLTALEEDGLLSNRKAGMAAVETGALSGRVLKDVYLQGVWLAALDAYARMGDALEARPRLAKARAALEKWFVEPRGNLAFGLLDEGGSYSALTSWQAFALAHGGLDSARAARAAASLNRPELSTDWGTRLFATDSPSYDPLSYNDGSVWPFVTGFVIEAEYRHHRAQAGLQHLHAVASMTGLSGAGFIPEYLSGDRAQQLPRAVPHQLFSSSAVVRPLVAGLLGLEGDATAGALEFSPHLPADWPAVRFTNFRVGRSRVSGEAERKPGALRLTVKVDGDPLRIVFSPAFPPGTEFIGFGGKVIHSDADVHAVTEAAASRGLTVEYKFREGVEPLAELISPEPGDVSRAARLVATRIERDRIAFEFAGPAGSRSRVRAACGPDWEPETQGYRNPRGGLVEVPVYFPGNGEKFTSVEVIFRRAKR